MLNFSFSDHHYYCSKQIKEDCGKIKSVLFTLIAYVRIIINLSTGPNEGSETVVRSMWVGLPHQIKGMDSWLIGRICRLGTKVVNMYVLQS